MTFLFLPQKLIMSAVGSDAALMLEKALEEMDDIFKDNDEPKTFIQSTPVSRKPAKSNKAVSTLIKLLDELEFLLSSQILDDQETLNEQQKKKVFDHVRTLSFASGFLKEFYEPTKTTVSECVYLFSNMWIQITMFSRKKYIASCQNLNII